MTLIAGTVLVAVNNIDTNPTTDFVHKTGYVSKLPDEGMVGTPSDRTDMSETSSVLGK